MCGPVSQARPTVLTKSIFGGRLSRRRAARPVEIHDLLKNTPLRGSDYRIGAWVVGPRPSAVTLGKKAAGRNGSLRLPPVTCEGVTVAQPQRMWLNETQTEVEPLYIVVCRRRGMLPNRSAPPRHVFGGSFTPIARSSSDCSRSGIDFLRFLRRRQTRWINNRDYLRRHRLWQSAVNDKLRALRAP